MSDLAGLIQKARDRKKSRYSLAKTFGYSGTEAGFMQSWSVDRIKQQAIKDGRFKSLGNLHETVTDVTIVGDNN